MSALEDSPYRYKWCQSPTFEASSTAIRHPEIKCHMKFNWDLPVLLTNPPITKYTQSTPSYFCFVRLFYLDFRLGWSYIRFKAYGEKSCLLVVRLRASPAYHRRYLKRMIPRITSASIREDYLVSHPT